MRRGKFLTEFEKGQIAAFKEAGYSNREIAKKIGRSASLVDNFVEDPDRYGKNHAGGWTQKLTPRTKRQIQAAAAQSTICSWRLRSGFAPPMAERSRKQNFPHLDADGDTDLIVDSFGSTRVERRSFDADHYGFPAASGRDAALEEIAAWLRKTA